LETYQNSTTIIGNLLGEDSYHTSYSQMYSIDPSCNGTLIKNNYNTVNDAVNAAEAIGTDTMRDSYAYASKPAWWGNLPWPAFDPGQFSKASPTNIPAGYRAIMGTDPATGPVNLAPVAVANSSPKLGLPPLAVTFSSAGSSDPEGAALSYSWTFGDGGTSISASRVHTYSTAGSYVARLTVSDRVNTTTSADVNIGVGNQPPSPPLNFRVVSQ